MQLKIKFKEKGYLLLGYSNYDKQSGRTATFINLTYNGQLS